MKAGCIYGTGQSKIGSVSNAALVHREQSDIIEVWSFLSYIIGMKIAVKKDSRFYVGPILYEKEWTV